MNFGCPFRTIEIFPLSNGGGVVVRDYSGYYLLVPQKEDHLSHHGIKGQKWGVKHGPPYPLQQKTGDLVSYAVTKGVGLLTDLTVGAAKRGIAKARVSADDKRRSKNENIDKKTGFHLKDPNKEYSDKDDISRINPGFAQARLLADKTTTNNCVYCTTAFELRKRGYDVRAKKADSGHGLDNLEVDALWKLKTPKKQFDVPRPDVFTKAKRADRIKTYRDTIDWVKKQPDQRGNLAVHWGFSGHSMAYEIKGGKLTILDGQNGKIHSNGEAYLKELFGTNVFSDLAASDCSFRRTDNATPNWDEIKKRVE